MFQRLESINKRVALNITKIVGTMWCAYFFVVLTIFNLPHAINQGISGIIPWIAQTFLQLVLLSIIMVGQDIQSEKTEKRAEEDHKYILKEFTEIKDLHKDIHILIKELHER